MPFVRAVIRWLRGVGAGRRGEERKARGEKERKRGPQRWREEEEGGGRGGEREKGVGERESVSRGNQITRRGAQAGGLSFTVIN